MKEILDLNFNIKGHVGVAVINNKTGKVEGHIEGDNFIGKMTKRYIMSAGMSLMGHYLQKNNYNAMTNYSCLNPFERLVLTDNTEAVSSNAKIIPGNTIGYATEYLYSGGDTLRGTINVAESQGLINNKLKLVFDFPTHAANGTFKTIGFKYNGSEKLKDAMFVTDGRGLCRHNNIAYVCIDDSTLIKINLDSSEVEKMLLWQGETGYGGICCYDGKIYYLKDTGSYCTVYYYDLNTAETVNVCNLENDDYRSLFHDGDYFYAGNYYSESNGYLYKYDNDFTKIDKKKLPDYSYAKGNNLNEGWLMRPDGTELNINDFFNGTTETRRDYILEDIGYFPNIYNGKIYKNAMDSAGFSPSVWESSSDSGLAHGEKYGNKDIFGVECEYQNLGTCIVLPSAVTKNDTQTMKITYEFSFVI